MPIKWLFLMNFGSMWRYRTFGSSDRRSATNASVFPEVNPSIQRLPYGTFVSWTHWTILSTSATVTWSNRFGCLWYDGDGSKSVPDRCTFWIKSASSGLCMMDCSSGTIGGVGGLSFIVLVLVHVHVHVHWILEYRSGSAIARKRLQARQSAERSARARGSRIICRISVGLLRKGDAISSSIPLAEMYKQLERW